MSLVAAKNFMLPFTKRWQLFTMLLTVLLYTLLRVTLSRQVYQQPPLGTQPYAPSPFAVGYPQQGAAYGSVSGQSYGTQYYPSQGPAQQSPSLAARLVVPSTISQSASATSSSAAPIARVAPPVPASNPNLLQELVGSDGDEQSSTAPTNNSSVGLEEVEKKLGMR